MATGAAWRATATTSAIERECPSSVTGAVMRKEGTRPHTRRQACGGHPSVEFQDAKLQAVDRNVEWPEVILATHDWRPLATWHLSTYLHSAPCLAGDRGHRGVCQLTWILPPASPSTEVSAPAPDSPDLFVHSSRK